METDVVVIGGGTAGMAAARAVRHEGRRVLLVERAERGLGGDCTFTGCVPSKALIEVARLAHRARSLGGLGFAVDLDFPAVMGRQHEIVAEVAHDERAELFERAGIEVRAGEAELLGPGRVRVDGQDVGCAAVVLATGSEPSLPPIEGIDTTPHLTNDTIFGLKQLPRRLAVLGGGPIGVELGQAFGRFGSAVTIVEADDRLLGREEPACSAAVADALAAEGVTLRLAARAAAVRTDGDECVITLEGGDELCADALLVATGRRPGLDPEALGRAGVATDERGYITVDQRQATSADGIWAAGDCTGGLQFTHVAAHEGRVAGANAAGGSAKADLDVVPWVTFTDPEVARVGMTEAQARAEHGDAIEVVSWPMAHVDRARVMGETAGFVTLVVHRRWPLGGPTGGRLLGAHVVGPHAGEVLHEAVLALRTRAFAGRLAQTIHAYPTVSLALQQAAATLFEAGRAQVLIE